MQAHIDKINEMATVMRKAIEVDEGRICEDEEKIKQLEVKYINYFIKIKNHFFTCGPNNLKVCRWQFVFDKKMLCFFNNNPNNN